MITTVCQLLDKLVCSEKSEDKENFEWLKNCITEEEILKNCKIETIKKCVGKE